MTHTKPLAPGEIRIATAEDGTKVQLMEVAGGSFINVQVRRGLQLLFTYTWPSNFEHTALYEYGRQCKAHNAS